MDLTIAHITDAANVCREFYVEGTFNKVEALQAIKAKYTCPASYFVGEVKVYNKSSHSLTKL